MSQSYIDNEIDKVSRDYEFPLNLAMSAAWVLGNLKGINLKIFNMQKESSLSDYFVIGSANNATQANAMATEIGRQIKRLGHNLISQEGVRHSDWILLDAGDILVHIFIESARDVYGLDQLWKQNPKEEIPQEFYFSGDDEKAEENNDEKNYF